MDDRIPECPHCFGRIIPMQDGNCPSCWKDTASANETGRRRFSFITSAQLSPMCIACGRSTTRTSRIVHYAACKMKAPNSSGGILEAICWLALGPISLLLRLPAILLRSAATNAEGEESHDVTKLKLRIPVCRNCKSTPLQPLSADHTQNTIALACHSEFIKATEQLNA